MKSKGKTRAVARTLIGGGGGCLFIYSGSARLPLFEINFISKETIWAEPEYMNIHPSPPLINALATAPGNTVFYLSPKFLHKTIIYDYLFPRITSMLNTQVLPELKWRNIMSFLLESRADGYP